MRGGGVAGVWGVVFARGLGLRGEGVEGSCRFWLWGVPLGVWRIVRPWCGGGVGGSVLLGVGVGWGGFGWGVLGGGGGSLCLGADREFGRVRGVAPRWVGCSWEWVGVVGGEGLLGRVVGLDRGGGLSA